MSKESEIYGLRAVIEAIKSEESIEKIFIQKGLRGDLFHELEHHLGAIARFALLAYTGQQADPGLTSRSTLNYAYKLVFTDKLFNTTGGRNTILLLIVGLKLVIINLMFRQ